MQVVLAPFLRGEKVDRQEPDPLDQAQSSHARREPGWMVQRVGQKIAGAMLLPLPQPQPYTGSDARTFARPFSVRPAPCPKYAPPARRYRPFLAESPGQPSV
ncbi:hypothetical protein I532_11979 [Brevibacillus borstelensis AK1]|uniref:Uncharacterized protein n=1 Tax=Brevibacillus borstelensis AK1 TaxID=1300222 RepID=M8DZ94_9BACL|nr:hypothetical protein I532_11979 [Brevibacillus borstelensis AK1]